MNSGIYIITNIGNGHKYIGSAINIKNRFKRHKKDLRHNRHHSQYLQRAWNRYGPENFKFEVLEPVNIPLHLIATEQVYLDYFKPEYNISKIAGSCLGIKRSVESKLKMRNSALGRRHTDSAKEKCRLSSANRRHSEETKSKMSASRRNKRSVNQIDKISGMVICTYASISDASRAMVGSPKLAGNISKALNDSSLSCYGYNWCYNE